MFTLFVIHLLQYLQSSSTQNVALQELFMMTFIRDINGLNMA